MTTTTAKHSQTPWEFSADDKLNSQRAFGIVRSLPEGESQEPGHTEVIAEVCAGPTAESDATFIVRACNAHDDLLAACRAVLARLDLEPEGAIFPCSAQREMLRAAIAKAGGAA